MTRPKVKTGFTSLSQEALVERTRFIVQSMPENPNYPAPMPPIADVLAAFNAFSVAIADAMKGGPAQTAIKRQRRQELEILLRNLAGYVMAAANGNEAALISSGFELTKQPQPVGILEKPAFVNLANSPQSGTLKATVARIPGARSYVFEITPAPVTPASNWEQHISTGSKFVFTGLEPLKEYAVRVSGVGSDPVRLYSDVVSKLVL